MQSEPYKRKLKQKVALAVAAVLVLVVVTFIQFASTPDKPVIKPGKVVPQKKVKPAEYGSDAVDLPGPAKGVFKDAAVIPDSIGNIYYVGLYENTGDSAIRKPDVTVTLYSSTGKKVANGRGFGIHRFLLPGEVTPVKILVSRAPSHVRYEFTHEAEHTYSYTDLQRVELGFDNVKLSRGKYSGYLVKGEVKNRDSVTAKYVNVVALLLDSKGRIAGMGSTYLKQKKLPPKDYAPFDMNIITVKGKPSSFKLFYDCMIEK